jgi:aspartate racemase
MFSLNERLLPVSQQPQPGEVDFIHDTYVELAREGKGSEEQHRSLTALAHTLRARDEVDAIILAGTDLALIFNDASTDLQSIDCGASSRNSFKEE